MMLSGQALPGGQVQIPLLNWRSTAIKKLNLQIQISYFYKLDAFQSCHTSKAVYLRMIHFPLVKA